MIKQKIKKLTDEIRGENIAITPNDIDFNKKYIDVKLDETENLTV